ncbi:hypothetical protein [Streptomyces lydicus]|uniref:hypothetical protein n=1 Tax=Streptomyces lydicus TaxID=47763 RepID=UPI0013E90B9A|nr:hypothetical protein [Streptomyces lydicus]MDC7341228.1 hypothetical protein [Streptomyces lydicus]
MRQAVGQAVQVNGRSVYVEESGRGADRVVLRPARDWDVPAGTRCFRCWRIEGDW